MFVLESPDGGVSRYWRCVFNLSRPLMTATAVGGRLRESIYSGGWDYVRSMSLSPGEE